MCGHIWVINGSFSNNYTRQLRICTSKTYVCAMTIHALHVFGPLQKKIFPVALAHARKTLACSRRNCLSVRSPFQQTASSATRYTAISDGRYSGIWIWGDHGGDVFSTAGQMSSRSSAASCLHNSIQFVLWLSYVVQDESMKCEPCHLWPCLRHQHTCKEEGRCGL